MTAPVSESPAGATPTGPVEERPRGSRLRTLLIIAVVAIATVVGAYFLTRPTQTVFTPVQVKGDNIAPAPVVGDQARDFVATTISGEPMSLAQLEGRPVWLQFGASWCAPCRVEAPDVQAAHKASAKSRLAVVAVYLAEDSTTVKNFAELMKLTYTQVPDPDTAIASAWGVRGIPVHYFIDAKGTIKATHVGILPPDRIKEYLTQIGG